MGSQQDILVIGSTVRYLAQSGQRAGLAVTGVDAFGDDDMRAACRESHRATAVEARALYQAVPAGALETGMRWTYGAAFEAHPLVLKSLQQRNRRLLGNDPQVLTLLGEPRRWFRLLEELDVAFPAVSLVPPTQASGWLFKPVGGFGGLGVRNAVPGEAPEAEGFYQAFVRGPVCSLLFAADGSDVVPVGFNRVLARYPSAGDFRFAGVVGGLGFAPDQAAQMIAAARRLTRALGLRGINGLDFVVDAGRPRLLELNARPPASLELYEDRLPGGGLACHLAACEGVLPEVLPVDSVAGMRVLYSRRPLRLGSLDWPAAVRDRTPAGTLLASNQPVCSVHCQGPDTATVEARLREAADVMYERLQPFAEEAA